MLQNAESVERIQHNVHVNWAIIAIVNIYHNGSSAKTMEKMEKDSARVIRAHLHQKTHETFCEMNVAKMWWDDKVYACDVIWS